MAGQPLTLMESVALWIAFNVVIALAPLLFVLTAVSQNLWGDRTQKLDWSLLKDGELFFFSSTLCAAAIGNLVKLLFEGASLRDHGILTFVGLIIILFYSTLVFGGVLRDKVSPGTRVLDVAGSARRMGRLSCWTAAGAVVASFVAAYQGGFK